MFHLRTAFLLVAGVVFLALPFGPVGLAIAAGLWLVVVPYNLWLLRSTVRKGRLPASMAPGDQGLCVAFVAVFPWILPLAMIAAIIDLAVAAQAHSRRLLWQAAAISSAGFIAISLVQRNDLDALWLVAALAVFPISAVIVVLSVTSLTQRERLTSQRLADILNGLDAAIWQGTPDGEMTFVSRGLEDLYGHRREHWLADPAVRREMIHPEDRAHVDAARAEGLERRESYEWTARVAAADGTTRVVRAFVTPALDDQGAVAVLHGMAFDVTADHRARRELSERSREQLALLALAQIAAGETDLRSVQEQAVRTLAEVMDAPLVQLSTVEGTDVLELQAGVGWTRVEPGARNARYPEHPGAVSGHADEQIDDPLLDAHDVRTTAWLPIDTDDRYAVLGVHYPDDRELPVEKLLFLRGVAQLLVTTRRRHESEERLLRSQSTELLGQFAGGIAHDFNNLLMAVLGSTELLRTEAGIEAGACERVDHIEEAARAAGTLCEQLLALARGQQIRHEPFDLGELLTASAPLLGRLTGDDVAISVSAPAGRFIVHGSEGQLRQLLLNLVVNAGDAMPTGGRLMVTLAAAEDEPGRVRLTVTDTGHGMDRTTREHAPDAFFTTKDPGGVEGQPHIDPGRGTGLGLTTVQSIVRKHGGDLALDSEPGVGTTVTITLPLTDAAPAPPAEATPAMSPAAPLADRRTDQPSGEPALAPLADRRTVLVVDDHGMVGSVVGEALRARGCDVHVLDDPVEALDVAAALPVLDLLVTDVVMPGMSGRELSRTLRQQRPDLPVVYMSGHLPDETIPTDGVYLGKPFTLAELSAAVERSLDGREG